MLLVDEVDMAAPAKKDGFKGAQHYMKARFFYGCTACTLTAHEKNSF